MTVGSVARGMELARRLKRRRRREGALCPGATSFSMSEAMVTVGACLGFGRGRAGGDLAEAVDHGGEYLDGVAWREKR